ALDAFARGKTRALALVPLIHLFWVNSHQLWPLSLVVQGMFFADLVWRRDWRRARLVGVACVASALLTFVNPLGFKIVLGPMRTTQSYAIFRERVEELHRIWTLSHESWLALATGVPAAWALWRARRTTPLFEWGVWLMSLGLVLSAVRGPMFFGILSGGIFPPCGLRAAPPPALRVGRVADAAGAGAVGRARPDVLRHRERGHLPALRAADARRRR